MCARGRRHRDRRHPGECLYPVGERINQTQCALHGGFRLQRVQVGKPRQPGHFFVQTRIMFHRARAERIKPGINRIVLLAEPGVVTHHLRFRQPGQPDSVFPIEPAEAALHRQRFRQIDTTASRRILLKN